MNIKHISYYVPAGELPVEDLLGGLTDQALPAGFATLDDYCFFAESVLNLRSIRVEDRLSEVEMMSKVLGDLFAVQEVQPAQIGLLLMVSEVRSNPKYNPAQYLQHRFGMKRATVLNISGNHCANVSVALNLATRWCTAGESLYALILDVNKITDAQDRIIGSYGILGDAAGVILVGNGPSNLGVRSCVSLNNGLLHEANLDKDYAVLHNKYLIQSIRMVLARAGIAPGDVRHVILQNANPLLYTHAILEAGLGTETVFADNLGRYGHLNSLDTLVNLKDLSVREAARPGSLALSVEMGWAGSYSTALFALS